MEATTRARIAVAETRIRDGPVAMNEWLKAAAPATCPKVGSVAIQRERDDPQQQPTVTLTLPDL